MRGKQIIEPLFNNEFYKFVKTNIKLKNLLIINNLGDGIEHT